MAPAKRNANNSCFMFERIYDFCEDSVFLRDLSNKIKMAFHK